VILPCEIVTGTFSLLAPEVYESGFGGETFTDSSFKKEDTFLVEVFEARSAFGFRNFVALVVCLTRLGIDEADELGLAGTVRLAIVGRDLVGDISLNL